MLNSCKPPPSLRRRPTGMAALTVVMVLFFVMALGAAYTNRTLILEQRISLGTYRAAKALEASEAALNLALGLMNGGLVNAQCQPSVNPADNDYRLTQYTELPPDKDIQGAYGLMVGRGNATHIVTGCIMTDSSLNCSCAINNVANPAIAQPNNGIGSAFHFTTFSANANNNQPAPGVWGVYGTGCGSLGTGRDDCSKSNGSPTIPKVDGIASVALTMGLLRALPLAPVAALTAGGSVDASAGSLKVSNPDSASGYTVLSGGAYVAGTNDEFAGPAGSGVEGRRHSISQLSDLAALANDGWFKTVFAMDRVNYGSQPAARFIDCAGGCDQTHVAAVLAGYPRNPIVLEGNLTLNDASTLGSAANPVMLVINGVLTLSGNATVTGFLHANSVVWSASTATLSGALLTPGSVAITGTARLRFDRPVIDIVRLRYGSLVRTTGSFNVREGYY